MKSQKHLTIVIKLGTSSIVDEKTHEPLLSILTLIVETAVKLHKNGHKVVIVSSGAIGIGLRRMDVEKRPKQLARKQALAAVGQCRLVSLWDNLFTLLRQPVAQILLTRNDIADRAQYLNAQNTFSELLNMGVIPIVNENDTVAVTEIKFGDNDTLSAITAAMVQADFLFLMTDVDCLYSANPRTSPDAQPIAVVRDISNITADVSSSGSSLGTGGMSTKIVAARLATSAGVTTVITRSSKPGNVLDIIEYVQAVRASRNPSTVEALLYSDLLPKPPLHTCFLPSSSPIRDRSFWLLHGLAPHGTIYIDEGAYLALLGKAGLLPVGVVDVDGPFAQQEAVRLFVVKRKPRPSFPSQRQSPSHTRDNSLAHSSSSTSTPPTPSTASLSLGGIASYELGGMVVDPMPPATPSADAFATSSTSMMLPHHASLFEETDPEPREVGRALVNYSSVEIARIKGLRSGEIGSVLGYADSEYVALRENVSVFGKDGEDGSGGGKNGEDIMGESSGVGAVGNLGAFG